MRKQMKEHAGQQMRCFVSKHSLSRVLRIFLLLLLLFVRMCDRQRQQQNLQRLCGVPEVIVAAAAAAAAKGGAGRTKSAEESPEYTFEAKI